MTSAWKLAENFAFNEAIAHHIRTSTVGGWVARNPRDSGTEDRVCRALVINAHEWNSEDKCRDRFGNTASQDIKGTGCSNNVQERHWCTGVHMAVFIHSNSPLNCIICVKKRFNERFNTCKRHRFMSVAGYISRLSLITSVSMAVCSAIKSAFVCIALRLRGQLTNGMRCLKQALGAGAWGGITRWRIITSFI